MTIGNKDIFKWIRQEGNKLPPDEYYAFHKYWPRTHFNEKKQQLIGEWGQHPVNHCRRLKRLWKRTHDFSLINEYFKKYGLQLNYKP